ncbi:lysophospholipid acyltransferase family protein [Aeromicrobium sp.]|uniref:lysophospholipid acyltransferase family protein n=1 Tax=Aeromicrobium sp. TaxID=1871063 RepID=UPI001986BB69|nr:lysophospholipid acyltransferase family protein [Aeromicrobium sp.]MBC7630829.1 acyltransferase family protein [Aeromicrobium sp.]
MPDERKTIGSGGQPGRGNRSTSPSAAARSIAGSAPARKPVTKVKKAVEPVATRAATMPKKAAPAAKKKATASKPATKQAAAPVDDKPRLRAVTEEDAAAAAAAAADEAARRTRTAGAAPLSAGIPIDEIMVAVVQAAQRVLGTDWESRIAVLLATIRKRLSGDYEVDEFGFDPQITEVMIAAIEPLAEKWFRLEVRGIENIPTEGGALLVANHSGTVPIDGMITGYAVKKYAGRNLRPLGADLVFSLPFVGQVARKVGVTLACQEDTERLLTTGELAGVWPEGFKGIGKPFAERYKLQRFGRGGFVSSAMRAQVPIVPVSIVGAEEIYPLVGNVPSLARLLGLPYLPITPFFPLLGPLGLVPLPSKWIIEFGEPIRTDAFEPEAADDPMLLFNVTDQVRETIQQTLYGLLVDRGNAFF